MRKRLHESKYFRLQQEHTAKGRRFYRIVWHSALDNIHDVEPMRDIVDPQRNKSGRTGSHWKFGSRAEAEKYYTMLLLRWA
jgi:hypothetical protein